MMRNLKSIVLIFVFTLLLSNLVLGAELIVNVDGVDRSMTAEIIESKTFVSIESLEGFGLDTQVNGDKVTLDNEDVEFIFVLDSNQVKVNGLSFTLASKAYSKDNLVYLPLRFILETLNYKIDWSSNSNKVIASKKAETQFPLVIKDGENRYVVESEATTIVSMSPGVTEKLFALGVGDRIKGRTQYCNYPAGVSDIENIGSLYEPNLELIVDISPDIVLAETHFKQAILDKLGEAGINSAAKSSANNMEDVYDYMLNLGVIVGREYEARGLVASLKDKVARVKYILRDISDADKPSVYYVVGTGQYGEYTAGRNTFIADLLSIAGAKNVANDVEGWSYSLEKLIDHDPDFLIGGQFNIDTMLNGDNYQALSAVQNDKYLFVNEDIFSRATPRAVDEGLKILIELFHRDKLKELNF